MEVLITIRTVFTELPFSARGCLSGCPVREDRWDPWPRRRLVVTLALGEKSAPPGEAVAVRIL